MSEATAVCDPQPVETSPPKRPVSPELSEKRRLACIAGNKSRVVLSSDDAATLARAFALAGPILDKLAAKIAQEAANAS